MKLVRYIKNLDEASGRVITLGNFDGVHLGHQALITELKKESKKSKLPTLIVIFEPQPKEYFSEIPHTPRLMRFREKYETLKKFEIDTLLCLRFNSFIANLSPYDFVKKILVKHLKAKIIIIGNDFCFGVNRQGNKDTLLELAKEFNFSVKIVPDYWVQMERVSSTRIRNLLKQNNLKLAEKLLGHSFSLAGKVIRGEQRGRDLGFPTANINLHRQLVPISGVFVIQTTLNHKIFKGVANIGLRPTFAGTRILLEVHLFDFSDSLYGKNLVIVFLKKLRDEIRFNSLNELVVQIKKDVEAAQKFLITNG